MEEKHASKINLFVGRLFLNSRFDILFGLVLITLLVGTIFYSFVEGWSILDSLYFSVVTLMTVGFGDFAPVTNIGKIFTIVYLFVGIGILLGFVNFITDQALKYKIREKKEVHDEEVKQEVKQEVKKVKKKLKKKKS